MSSALNVLVVGGTGNTGESVINGLLNSPDTKFNVTVLTRESSLGKPIIQSFQSRGVKVATGDLLGPREDLVNILRGIDVVVSCMYYGVFHDQIPLAIAAKEAGVKRFVPSHFNPPMPRGVFELQDTKDDVLAAIQREHLPWTVIDVGWWTEQLVPALPSGRTAEYNQLEIFSELPGDGTTPVCITHRPDIGRYVAKVIADPRTLNRKVFAYTEMVTLSQLGDLMSELSGEKPISTYVPGQELEKRIREAKEALAKDPGNAEQLMKLYGAQYLNSWGVRGDNTPEAAKVFGYLDFKELYPGITGVSAREVFQGVVDQFSKA